MSVKDEDSFSRAGDVLKTIFASIAPSGIHSYTELYASWGEIAGSEMAFHLQPRDIRDGTLILESDHPGWSQKLLLTERKILREIQSRYPELEVRAIHLQIRNTDGPGPAGSVGGNK